MEKQAKNTAGGGAKKLKDPENRYRRLFETAQDGILILEADTGQIQDVNPFLMRLLGRTREELLGKRLWEIGPFKDIAASKAAFEELQHQEYIRYEDLPLETSDGCHLDVEFVSNVYEVDHQRVIQCNIRDITKRKLAEEALRESERKLDRVLQTIMDGLVIVDLSGQIVYANRAAGIILNIAKDDMLGRNFSSRDWRQIDENGDPYPPERLPLTIAIKEQREVDIIEHLVIDADGQIKWLSINAAPLFDENHKIYGAVASFRDITRRKQAEEALQWAREELEIRVRERTQELNQTNEQLRIEIAERQRLAQNLHDGVNQSLFSAGLIAEVLPRLWYRDRTTALKSLEDLRRLTRGAQAEMRALLAELRPSVLTEAELGDLLRLLGNGLTGRMNIPVTVLVAGEGSLPGEVQVTLYRMCQEALNNIARHAGASQVKITLKHEAGAIEMQIHDNGRGFDTGKPAPVGHYGLSMMRERAEAVGALLMIKSQPGEGTDIIIRWQEQPDKGTVKP